jgi:glycosyltransferase involved in cell wall biosynthesis
VELELYCPQDKKNKKRSTLYAGYLPREKVANDIYTIIEAVLDQKRDVEFILAVRTKNPREAFLKKRLYTKLQAKFGKRVHFIENSSEMVSAIRRCDILMYPFFEGFERKIDIPFVIAEAMSCAKAVLVSDIAPLNEPFKKMGGMLTKAKNAKDFASELAALCSDEETLKSAGRANKAIADSLFNIKNNMGVIETIYSRAGNG